MSIRPRELSVAEGKLPLAVLLIEMLFKGVADVGGDVGADAVDGGDAGVCVCGIDDDAVSQVPNPRERQSLA